MQTQQVREFFLEFEQGGELLDLFLHSQDLSGLSLSVGFEQILLQRNAVGPAAGEVLDTYVYFKGIVGGQWGITAAAGLIKGIFGTVLVIGANKLAHRMGQEGVYS